MIVQYRSSTKIHIDQSLCQQSINVVQWSNQFYNKSSSSSSAAAAAVVVEVVVAG
jgi:hypothetical protein